MCCPESKQLLPMPRRVEYQGGYLDIGRCSIISSIECPEDAFTAAYLESRLRKDHGLDAARGDVGTSIRIVMSRTGETGAFADLGEAAGPGSRQSYSLIANAGGIVIESPSSAGLFYGAQTLLQLVESRSGHSTVPTVSISDWPETPCRAVLFDISHYGLPTVDEALSHIDFLARYKTNQFWIYSEASIEMEGYPLAVPDGRWSKADVRKIVEYGRERFIDVIPNLDLYGHMHDLLRTEKYTHLSSKPHGPELDAANPAVRELLEDWADQISGLFPSRFVHIGFDEVWQIEEAARKSGKTPAHLFNEQITFVTECFKKNGKTVLAWADMVVKYPELFDRLPGELLLTAWDYEAEPRIDRFVTPLSERGALTVVQSGVANWREISPDFSMTMDNIDNLLAAGRAHGATWHTLSLWNDSPLCLFRASLPMLAYGSAAGWQKSSVRRDTFYQDFARVEYGENVADTVARAVSAANDAELSFQKVFGKATVTALFTDPLRPECLELARAHREDLSRTRLFAEAAVEEIWNALEAGCSGQVLESLLIGVKILDYAGYKFLCAVEMADAWECLGKHPSEEDIWTLFASEWLCLIHGRLNDLLDDASHLKEPLRKAWLSQYTEYRLNSPLCRLDAECEYWRSIQQELTDFFRFRSKDSTLPELRDLLPSGRGRGFHTG